MTRTLLLLLCLGLSACGTVAGIGEDITSGARTVQNNL